MDKQIIALLYGGRSGEHDVSLRSAAFVFENIDKSVYDILPIGISREGIWYLQPETLSPKDGILPIVKSESEIVSAIPGCGLSHMGKMLSIHLVFPILHGSFGEDGTVQGLLELTNLPYAGADVPGCALSMDKELIKMVWQDANLPVVPFVSLLKGDFKESDGSLDKLPETFMKKIIKFGLPLFVKPANTGSSLGVNRVDSMEELQAALSEAFKYDIKLLVEPCITAREIECSVIGNHKPRTFLPGEIVTKHTFYDYEAKYSDPDGAELLIPAPLPEGTRAEIMRVALEAYRSAGISGMARVDFFVNEKGEPFLNELNAIPGFTSISMYPMMCAEGGLDNKALINELIDLGLSRFEERKGIRYSI
ncbi:MAG: D-alanine--D-alanine ligase [Spirochaetales bacterium]|nr:D-alanine--D-alanine ligase [Spirochaetales bacterium]